MSSNDHLAEEVPLAHGLGEEAFDAPSAFFLTHRARIESWADLGPRADSQVVEWYRRTVARELEEITDARMELYDLVDPGGHRSVTLGRPEWGSDLSRMSIGLGWKNTNVLEPYVFVRAPQDTWRAFLAQVGDLPAEHGYLVDQWWDPVFRYPTVPHRWWTDLDSFARLLVDEVKAMIVLFEPVVIATLATLREAE